MNKPTLKDGTHYHTASKTLFNVEECENCGKEVQAVNAIGLHNPQDFNLIYVDVLPPEQGWNDDLGGCDCDDCRTYE
jgi:hypothetical protein